MSLSFQLGSSFFVEGKCWKEFLLQNSPIYPIAAVYHFCDQETINVVSHFWLLHDLIWRPALLMLNLNRYFVASGTEFDCIFNKLVQNIFVDCEVSAGIINITYFVKNLNFQLVRFKVDL